MASTPSEKAIRRRSSGTRAMPEKRSSASICAASSGQELQQPIGAASTAAAQDLPEQLGTAGHAKAPIQRPDVLMSGGAAELQAFSDFFFAVPFQQASQRLLQPRRKRRVVRR